MKYDKLRSLVTPDLGVHLLSKDGLLNQVSLVRDFVVYISVRDVGKELLMVRLVSDDVVSVQLKHTHFLYSRRS